MKIIKIYNEEIHKEIKLMAVESGVNIEVIIKKLLDFYKENGRKNINSRKKEKNS